MLGNMHKMAAPSGLRSGYFIGPLLLTESFDFNLVFTVVYRKTFLIVSHKIYRLWPEFPSSVSYSIPLHNVCYVISNYMF